MDSQIWESSVDGQVTEAIAEIMDWNVSTALSGQIHTLKS